MQPDIAVPAEAALRTVHREALRRLVAKIDDPLRKQYLSWALESVEAEQQPFSVEPAKMARCAGVYGDEVFQYSDGTLYHHNKVLVRKVALIPMADLHFIIDDEVRVRFELPDAGPATAAHIFRQGGHSIRVERGE